MTNKPNHNISTVSHSSKVVRIKRRKKTLKKKQSNKANDEIKEREYPGCKVVMFF